MIIARLRRVFGLAADPVAITAQLTKDPMLAALMRARPGLRVPGAWDGFELGHPGGMGTTDPGFRRRVAGRTFGRRARRASGRTGLKKRKTENRKQKADFLTRR
jgi:hypothetical protein